MFDLLYPLDPAPVLPLPTADAPSVSGRGLEMFPVIEESGIVVGRASRSYCHSGVKLLHPVVHLHIIDREGRLFMQKRSLHKDIQPGKWDTSVGGHVDYGEMLVEALMRETREELGLTRFNPIYLLSYIYESEVEREMVNVFAAVGHFDCIFDRDEIEETRWWSQEEIDANMGKGVFTPNFESEYDMIRRSLLALL